MFLINGEEQLVLYYDGKITRIEGQFDKIKRVIEDQIPKFVYEENYFINAMLCNDFFDPSKDTIIVDLYRKKEFKISSNLVSLYGGIDSLLNLFFSFNQNKRIQKKYVLAFGGKVVLSKQVNITTEKELLKNAFIIKTKKISSEYFIAYCYFPYCLGAYEKHQSFISNICKGVSSSKKIAEKKALSEAIERLSASLLVSKGKKNVNEELIIENSYFDIQDFKKNKKNIIFDKIKPFFHKKSQFCPFDVLYYPYGYTFECVSNSNGMATHITYKQALSSALFELIERDAYILMWLLKTGVVRIEVSSLKGTILNRIRWIEEQGLKLYVLIIKFDNPIPVCCVIVEKGYKNILVSGAGITLEYAIEKAIEEVLGVISFFDLNPYVVDKVDGGIKNHIKYYLRKGNAKKLTRLKKSPVVKYQHCKFTFKTFITIKDIIKYYQGLGIKFYIYNYKNNINKIFGRYTVRIISDTLLPIYFGETIPLQIYNSKRLKDFKDRFDVIDINKNLHPMG